MKQFARRIRSPIKYSALALLLLVATTLIASYRWSAGLCHPDWYVGISYGTLNYGRHDGIRADILNWLTNGGRFPPPKEGFVFGRTPAVGRKLKWAFHSSTFSATRPSVLSRMLGGIDNHLVGEVRCYSCQFPLLPLTLAMLGFTYFLFWQDRFRPKSGHCRTCNYNLTGNTSGICPECGTPCRSVTPAERG
jgi:hypothetical protein